MKITIAALAGVMILGACATHPLADDANRMMKMECSELQKPIGDDATGVMNQLRINTFLHKQCELE